MVTRQKMHKAIRLMVKQGWPKDVGIEGAVAVLRIAIRSCDNLKERMKIYRDISQQLTIMLVEEFINIGEACKKDVNKKQEESPDETRNPEVA